ncbi:MAG TPA: LysE family transporter [Microvirga sp.]|jgi:threonine/homoserine/homoserine lactone efflux protein|nr:LysE family transporter [Microvirga sp.]
MTSLTLATFLVGISIGLAVAVPIGPMGLLCIQRTIAFGLGGGLAIGLAAATVQVAYGTVAVLGFGPTLQNLAGAGAALSLASAMLLLWFAYRLVRGQRPAAIAGSPRLRRDLATSYGAALTFGFSNPLTVLLFFAAFPALASADAVADGPALVGGVFAGAMGWYLVLSGAVAMFRERLSEAAVDLTNKASGAALGFLGLLLIVSTLRTHL